jgi:hypothetical protein
VTLESFTDDAASAALKVGASPGNSDLAFVAAGAESAE